jgi:hypothetical protein
VSDLLPRLRAPLLGLFGKEDSNPSPEHVAELDEILTADNKPHGWERITAFSLPTWSAVIGNLRDREDHDRRQREGNDVDRVDFHQTRVAR